MTQSNISVNAPVIPDSPVALIEIATRDLQDLGLTAATRGHRPSWLYAQVPDGLTFCVNCWRLIAPRQLGVEPCPGPGPESLASQ